MSVVRWTFTDSDTDETIVLPINPNEASPPEASRNMRYAWGSHWGGDRMRLMDTTPQAPLDWTFGGVIYTQEHYDLLLEWTDRGTILFVTDHLGRAFEVIISKFDPVDRTPTPHKPWRFTYTMTCLMLEEVT